MLLTIFLAVVICAAVTLMMFAGVAFIQDIMGMKLVRTKTLAEGGDLCDFRYSRFCGLRFVCDNRMGWNGY